MYAFHNKMILLVRLNRDFVRKNPVLALGFEPTSFQLISTCQGITRLASLHLFKLTTNPLFLHCVEGPPFYKVGFLQPPLKSFQVCPNPGSFLAELSVSWCKSKPIINLLSSSASLCSTRHPPQLSTSSFYCNEVNKNSFYLDRRTTFGFTTRWSSARVRRAWPVWPSGARSWSPTTFKIWRETTGHSTMTFTGKKCDVWPNISLVQRIQTEHSIFLGLTSKRPKNQRAPDCAESLIQAHRKGSWGPVQQNYQVWNHVTRNFGEGERSDSIIL